MQKRHTLKVRIHQNGSMREEPIGQVEEVRVDPLGTKVVTDSETRFYPADEYERVETEWVDKQTANKLVGEFK